MKSYRFLVEELQLDPLLGTADLAVLFGISETHVRRLVRQGKIAAPIRIGGRKLRWRTSTARKLVDEFEDAGGPAALGMGRRS